jgi:hypothetical protein
VEGEELVMAKGGCQVKKFGNYCCAIDSKPHVDEKRLNKFLMDPIYNLLNFVVS